MTLWYVMYRDFNFKRCAQVPPPPYWQRHVHARNGLEPQCAGVLCHATLTYDGTIDPFASACWAFINLGPNT